MVQSTKKIGRNAPCPCGSGQKYKICCKGKEQARSLWVRLGVVALAVVLAGGVIAAAVGVIRGGSGESAPTRVWSEAHGHWH